MEYVRVQVSFTYDDSTIHPSRTTSLCLYSLCGPLNEETESFDIDRALLGNLEDDTLWALCIGKELGKGKPKPKAVEFAPVTEDELNRERIID